MINPTEKDFSGKEIGQVFTKLFLLKRWASLFKFFYEEMWKTLQSNEEEPPCPQHPCTCGPTWERSLAGLMEEAPAWPSLFSPRPSPQVQSPWTPASSSRCFSRGCVRACVPRDTGPCLHVQAVFIAAPHVLLTAWLFLCSGVCNVDACSCSVFCVNPLKS